MSFAAFAASMGNALNSIDDRHYLEAQRQQQLDSGKRQAELQGLQIQSAKNIAADMAKQRSYQDAYDNILRTSGNDKPTYLKAAAAKAQELGDTKGFGQFTNDYASELQKQFSDKMNRGLRHFMISGDPSVLQENFNSTSPGMKISIAPTETAGRYTLTSTTPDGKQTPAQDVGRDDIGRLTMMAMDPKFAETIFKDQAKNDLTRKLEAGKLDDKLKRDSELEKIKSRLGIAADERRADREAENIKLRGAQDRQTGASNAAAQGAQQRQTHTWKTATDAAFGGGDGAMSTKELDKRSQTAVTALQKALGEDEFGRLKQLNQPLYLKAIKEIEARVHAGAMPFQAASEVTIGLLQQGAAKTAADSMSQPGGAKGLPLRPTVTLPAF